MSDSPSSHVSYDDLPYDGGCVRTSHPFRMAAMGQIFGMNPPKPRTARVLELGCAGGSNLLPMAFGMPDATFVGIDLSPRQIEIARARANQLHLRNIDLRALDIQNASELEGEFDYIICHGVYSWVPEPVREGILSTIRSKLSPQGIAFVSYNTLPGWHLRQPVRDMMVYHSRYFPDLEERAMQARALVDFVAEATGSLTQLIPGIDIYRQAVEATREVVARYPDYYVMHEFLEQDNRAFYLYQFVDQLSHAELQYLGDTNLAAMVSHNLPSDIASTLDRISVTNVALEQYRDFLVNRAFRHSLVCQPTVELDRKIPPEVAFPLYYRMTHIEQGTPPDEGFAAGADGRQIDIRSEAAAAVVTSLRASFSLQLSFRELATATGITDRDVLARLLLNLLAHDVVEVSVAPFPAPAKRRQRPNLWPPINVFAAERLAVPTPSHHAITLNEAGRLVLGLLDGTRAVAEIQKDAFPRLKQSELTFDFDGTVVEAKRLTRKQSDTLIRRFIETFRHHGVIGL